MSRHAAPTLQRVKRALLALMFGLCLMPSAQAHLMVAQRGTLNLVGDGAFMVLSLPVSAFIGIDDDGDGQVSTSELQVHAAEIESQVRIGVQLLDGERPLPLQGVLLQPSSTDHSAGGRIRQIAVLGRFPLGDRRSDLRLRFRLFGTGSDELAQEMTVSRGEQVQRLLLTPGRDQGPVLPVNAT